MFESGARYDALVPRNDLPTRRPPLPKRLPFTLRRQAPWTVRGSLWLLISVSAVEVILLAWTTVTFDLSAYLTENVGTFEREGRELQITRDIAVGTFVFGVVVAALGTAARLVFTLLMARGRNWARIVVSILFAARLLPPYDLTPIAAMMTLASVVAVVLLWLPRSNTFFRDVTSDRRAHRAKLLS